MYDIKEAVEIASIIKEKSEQDKFRRIYQKT